MPVHGYPARLGGADLSGLSEIEGFRLWAAGCLPAVAGPCLAQYN